MVRETKCATPILLGFWVLGLGVLQGQSYGPGAQVRTISAAEFQSGDSQSESIGSDGYLSLPTSSLGDSPTFSKYWAPLGLPEGASIEKVCLWANDSDTDYSVDATLVAAKLTPGGESPMFKEIAEPVFSTSDLAYRVYCADVAHTVRGRIDIDGDGTLDAVAYYVTTSLAFSDHLGVGAVQITWRRSVSAPPPVPTFGDVPVTDPAYAHIEALAASGITVGCPNGNFCPDASLTRRQMAVFLSKALGLYWPD
jgi:hypothetical protein